MFYIYKICKTLISCFIYVLTFIIFYFILVKFEKQNINIEKLQVILSHLKWNTIHDKAILRNIDMVTSRWTGERAWRTARELPGMTHVIGQNLYDDMRSECFKRHCSCITHVKVVRIVVLSCQILICSNRHSIRSSNPGKP